MINVIPAIDILDGKVVRLRQGDYDQVSYYENTPSEQAKIFEEAGAKRIHIVDLNGAKEAKLVNHACLEEIRKTVSCDLEFGGGIRSKESINNLFDLGINYCILGSLLVNDFSLAEDLIRAYPSRLIAGIDANEDLVATEGWLESKGETIQALIQKLNTLPISSIIYTDIQRDGTLEGPNLERLSAVCDYSHHPIIASGGIGSEEDIHSLDTLKKDNCYGVIVGKAILSQKIDLSRLWNNR